jgi:hypothetical protein
MFEQARRFLYLRAKDLSAGGNSEKHAHIICRRVIFSPTPQKISVGTLLRSPAENLFRGGERSPGSQRIFLEVRNAPQARRESFWSWGTLPRPAKNLFGGEERSPGLQRIFLQVGNAPQACRESFCRWGTPHVSTDFLLAPARSAPIIHSQMSSFPTPHPTAARNRRHLAAFLVR